MFQLLADATVVVEAWRPKTILEFYAVTLGWVIIGLIGLVICYVVFDRLVSKISFHEELSKGNVAVAIFVGSILVSAALIVAAAIHIQ